jgi:hypothetical protein
VRVEAFNLHAAVGGAVLTNTNRASNDASANEDRRAHRRSFPLLVTGSLLIEALRATINGCSASVTESGGWCVAAPANTNRLAPLTTTVNDQNREK